MYFSVWGLTACHRHGTIHDMRVPEIVGARIKEQRQELGWTQDEFAEYLAAFLGRKWFPQAVSDAERGNRDFTAEEILAIARTLGRAVSWFFELPPGEEQVHYPSLVDYPEKDRELYSVDDTAVLTDEIVRLVKRLQKKAQGE
jgi:transcriptional regulator with XRE-family HTH domain